MKKIEAYIKEHRLNEVIERLHEIDGLTGVSFFNIKGYGRARNGDNGQDHISDNPLNRETHIKLEIVCKDEVYKLVIDTIQKAAHTGLKGDGEIFVFDITEVIRISDNERGESAL